MKEPLDVLKLVAGQKELAEILAKSMGGKLPIISVATHEALARYITNDPAMLETKRRAAILSGNPDPVLIQGPSGTGKELLARALHGDRQGKFIGINCTSLPSELIESELFGHERGAFTGADKERAGKLQAAWRGTLFLDEIGDMPMTMQAKLLRVIQEKVYSRLGGNDELKVECRIIAATNKSKEILLGNKHFREDLYWRLAVYELHTTSLADRVGDVDLLVRTFDTEGKWPADWKLNASKLTGNVRQLQSIIKRYQTLGIKPEELV